MRRHEAIRKLSLDATALRSRGATGLFLFGSAARDEASPDSDIDLFLDYDPARKFSLVDLAGIKLRLEQILGRDVDVTTRDGLHPALRRDIEQSAVRIF
jgi:predicted nucleotidyltransferase